jgi:hypothetical protein
MRTLLLLGCLWLATAAWAVPTALVRDKTTYVPVHYVAGWVGAAVTVRGGTAALTMGTARVPIPVKDAHGRALPKGYVPLATFQMLLREAVVIDTATRQVIIRSALHPGRYLRFSWRHPRIIDEGMGRATSTVDHATAPTVADPDPDAASPLTGGTPAIRGSDVGTPAPTPAVFSLVRVRHSAASWNAYAGGAARFLTFLKPVLPCRAEVSTVALADLGAQPRPPLLYLYADAGLAFSEREIRILRQYVDDGGLLFVDSAPDPAVIVAVRRVLGQVAGAPLTALPANHPVTTFQFALPAPGVGEHARLNPREGVDNCNFGAMRGARLAIFYTPGNLFRLFSLVAADAHPYFTAQYQMAANVVVYAARHAVPPAAPLLGADAAVTLSACEYLSALNAKLVPLTVDKPE